MFSKKCFIVLAMVFWLSPVGFSDDVPPSTSPPGGLSPQNVPQFVNIGFDDNACDDGMIWVMELFRDKTNPVGINNNPLTYDGSPCRVVFYCTSSYGDWMKNIWIQAKQEGHEIGNHSVNHDCTESWSYNQWENEIDSCNNWLKINLDMTSEDLWGFRTPFLAFNTNTFSAVKDCGIIYDCTLNGGSATGNGTNYNWPYTLDGGSPGQSSGSHPGLWEVPTHHVIISGGDKQTGLDYNMWVKTSLGGSAMTKNQFVSTLKNTLDLRYNNNRAPFTFGAHSDYYSPTNNDANEACPNATCQDRRDALAEFIEYALSKPDVRIVTTIDIIKWMRNPVGLDQTPVIANTEKPVRSLSLSAIGSNIIKISFPSNDFYACKLYGVNGKLIKTIAEGYYIKGSYTLPLAKRDLAPGSYFVKLKGSNESRTLKIVSM